MVMVGTLQELTPTAWRGSLVKVNYLPRKELPSVVGGSYNENKTTTKSPGRIAAAACCCGVINIGDLQTVRRVTIPALKHLFFQRKHNNMKVCNI